MEDREERVSRVEEASLNIVPPLEGTRIYHENSRKNENLNATLFDPLVFGASAVAAAPLHATVTENVGSEEDVSSHTPVYRKVSVACRVALIVASALLVITITAIGIYYLAKNYSPTNTTVQYNPDYYYDEDDYRYYHTTK